jgi:GR25 family glycosyltransferase involved in LPS biosynthesis/glycosyltransferase involved in cell wall biosynthesis
MTTVESKKSAPVLVTFGEEYDDSKTMNVPRSIVSEIKDQVALPTAPAVDILASTPVYVIHLPTSVERLERLRTRLKHHGLDFAETDASGNGKIGQVHVVQAMTPQSQYVQRMFKGWPEASPAALALGSNTRPQASFYSHIKAIKEWLRSSADSASEWALFLEDDAVPHDDFRSTLSQIWSQVPAQCNIVLLTHFVSKSDGIQHFSTNLCTMTPNVWGAIGYMVRRSWAKKTIPALDRPIMTLLGSKLPIGWERVLQTMGPTLFTRPCLLIEESVNSTIQPDSQLAEHMRYFTQFRHNFKRYECKQVLDAWSAFESQQQSKATPTVESKILTSAPASAAVIAPDEQRLGVTGVSAQVVDVDILSIVDKSIESKHERKALPLLGLCVICKNEAHIIHEMIASVAPHCQFALFVDTGSTDGTQDKIAALCKEHKLPYEIHERPWDTKTRGDFQFDVNRTMALELIRSKCQFAFVMDADDVLLYQNKTADGSSFVPLLDKTIAEKHVEMDGFFMLVKSGSMTYPRAHILKMDRPWCYVDEIHEMTKLNVRFAPDNGNEKLTERMYKLAARTPICFGGHKKLLHDKGEFVIHSRRLGARTKDHKTQADKYTKDALQLERMMKRDPDNGRYVYLCGNSWRDAGEFAKARRYYQQFIAMENSVHAMVANLAFGFDARLQLATCAYELGCSLLEYTVLLFEAWKFDKRRAEPLAILLQRYNDEGTPHDALEYAAQMRPWIAYDAMLSQADREVYEWKLDYMIIETHIRAGELQEALDVIRHQVLKRGTRLNKAMPANVQLQMRGWMLQCLQGLKDGEAKDAGAGSEAVKAVKTKA